jgi:hypothetical protein
LRYRELSTVEQKTEASRVVSERLDYVNRAGSASEILREVLGLSTTLPEWVEGDLERIVHKFQTMELNETNLVNLRKELQAAGLGELFPEAITGLARGR